MRVLSAQAAPFGLVKSHGRGAPPGGPQRGAAPRTKADFKARRQRARDARKGS